MQKVGSAKLGTIGSAFGAVATIGGKSFQTISGGVAKWISKDREKIIGFIDTIGNNLTNGYNNLSTFLIISVHLQVMQLTMFALKWKNQFSIF